MIIAVLAQDSAGNLPTANTLSRFISSAELENIHVWGDHEGEWMSEWGGAGGTSQHSYAVLNEAREIVWQKDSGASTSVPELRQAVNDAY